MEVARDLQDSHIPSESIFPDGIWFITLAALAPSASVAQAIMTALDLREAPGQSLAETLVDRLRSKKMLLLVDNCEHLILPCVQLFEVCLSLSGVKFCDQPRRITSWAGGLPCPSMEIGSMNKFH
jgi:predicted ATPase